MKSKLNVLLLLLLLTTLTLVAARDARANAPVANNCVLSGAPTVNCVENLSLALGSVYSVPLTTYFTPSYYTIFTVSYSTPGCPKNVIFPEYFEVTLTYNNLTHASTVISPSIFIPTSSPQTMTMNLDLTNVYFTNCTAFPSCSQVIEVVVRFENYLCGTCPPTLGSVTYRITLKDPSAYSMDLKNGEVFYVGNDQHLHSQKWNSGWTYSSITPANGGWGTVAAEGWVAATPSTSNVFFKATNGMLYNIYRQGGAWHMNALSYAVNNVKSFIRLKGDRVYYVGKDCRVYYFKWNGSAWVYNVINPLGGWANKTVADAMDVSQTSNELFYRGPKGEVYRLFQNSGGLWAHELLLPSGCAGNILVDPQTNVVYFKGTDSKVHTLLKSAGAWQHQTLSATNVNYQVRGHLTKFPGENRVFYIGIDTLVHNIYQSGPAWYDFPLSYYVSPAVSNALAAEGKLFYFHGDNRIHNFYWSGTSWWDAPLVAAPANVQGCVAINQPSCVAGNTIGPPRR